jgi:hypothetical protein
MIAKFARPDLTITLRVRFSLAEFVEDSLAGLTVSGVSCSKLSLLYKATH